MTLKSRLRQWFEDHNDPVLFAGAGVAAQAGIPVWKDYLQALAKACEDEDPTMSPVIIEVADSGDYLLAADRFYTARLLPATRSKALSKPLEHFDITALRCLVELPLRRIVTTNYDRSLIEAYSAYHQSTLIDHWYPGTPLASLAYAEDPFIARIHGRIEPPQNLVLSSRSYEIISQDVGYRDFLLHMFTRENLLIIGFSFLDPAVTRILDIVREEHAYWQKGRHLALVPSGGDGTLSTRLRLINIEVFEYSPSDSHEELWTALCEVNGGPEIQIPRSKSVETIAAMRKYIAMCFSRLKMQKHMTSMRQTVVEGVICEEIRSCKEGVCVEGVSKAVARSLGGVDSSATALLEKSLRRLVDDSVVEEKEGRYFWTGMADDPIEIPLGRLAVGLVRRLVMREGLKQPEDGGAFKAIIERVILMRGWDLGAAFAAKKPPDAVDLGRMLDDVDMPAGLPRKNLYWALGDLLSHPNTEEAEALSVLGRASFGLELVLSAPKTAEFFSQVLPRRVYLDANVLLPMMVHGHPFHEPYRNAVERLVEAGENAGIDVELIVAEAFLEEIVGHRNIAIAESEFLNRDDKQALEKEASLTSIQEMNVFVAGYAAWLSAGNEGSFRAYVDAEAPYHDNKSVKLWLDKYGYRVISNVEAKDVSAHPEILHQLETGYNSIDHNRKDSRLIAHDALQLALLERDRNNGIGALFVSADRALREIMTGTNFAHLTSAMISEVGLTQIVDLLVGGATNDVGTARLYWGVPRLTETERIRSYLIDVALAHYDDAYAKRMADLVDIFAPELLNEALGSGISVPPSSFEDKKKMKRLLDTYEERFYEEMAKLRLENDQ